MTPSGTSPKPRKFISIRWIVSAVAASVAAGAVLGVGAFGERNARIALVNEMETRLLLEARNLALTSSRAMLTDFPELTLQPLLLKMEAEKPEVAFSVVVDRNSEIAGHADSRKLSTKFRLPTDLIGGPLPMEFQPGERLLRNDQLLVAASPVVIPGGRRIGTAIVGFRRAHIDSLIWRARRSQGLLVTGLLIVTVLFTWLLITHLLRPIESIREGLRRIGRGEFDEEVRVRDRGEFGLLAETINHSAKKLKTARTELLERERLSKEVELARQIQSSLLPADKTEADGFVIDGAHRAAAEVGGDFYDVCPLPDGRVAVTIADVSGKGLAGCLVTSMLSVLLRAFRRTEVSPSRLLFKLETEISTSLRPGTFITMFHGILDPVLGRLTFASAGHSPTLVYRQKKGELEWIKTRGIPLAAVRGGVLASTLDDLTIDFDEGDLLVQYTDGINEAFDMSGMNQFGFERLEEAVKRGAPNGCQAVVQQIRSAVEVWTGDQDPLDDETLLVIGCTEPSKRLSHDALAASELWENPVEIVAAARRSNHGLSVPAELEELTRIHDWLTGLPDVSELGSGVSIVLETALYELLANIVEHGYSGDSKASIEVWWAPASGRPPGIERPPSQRVRGGRFVIVDQSRPFRADATPRIDLNDLDTRTKGRGLGLEIIRTALSHVTYHPKTPDGNVTILAFDPERAGSERRASHGE